MECLGGGKDQEGSLSSDHLLSNCFNCILQCISLPCVSQPLATFPLVFLLPGSDQLMFPLGFPHKPFSV